MTYEPKLAYKLICEGGNDIKLKYSIENKLFTLSINGFEANLAAQELSGIELMMNNIERYVYLKDSNHATYYTISGDDFGGSGGIEVLKEGEWV